MAKTMLITGASRGIGKEAGKGLRCRRLEYCGGDAFS
jgi:short-subunit dehydrogenase